jgi:hypothetical protein
MQRETLRDIAIDQCPDDDLDDDPESGVAL